MAAAIRGIVPQGVTYPAGTPVEGTDFNAAYALLLRWWSLLDAPMGVDTTPLWEDLADNDDFQVALPGLSASGAHAVAAALLTRRATMSSSHQLAFDDIGVSWQGEGRYRLIADAVEQTCGSSGVTTSRRSNTCADLRKRPDGTLVFARIEVGADSEVAEDAFIATYALNRAKATMVQFQTHTDLLTGDPLPMRELLMPELELNGLVNSRADQTRADGEVFTDVRSLRETISTSERRQDNVIRTFGEFSDWFRSCTALFRPDGFHKLERFEISSLPNQRYQVIAQFHWQAETVNGASISLHTPLTWILVDIGDKYMRIERLLPFG